MQESFNEILDYNLDVDETIDNHDLACADQAGRLLKIGYLEYETAVYSIAYRKDHEIYIYMSDHVENIEQRHTNLLYENIFTSPIRYFFKRYDLIEETEEEVKHRFRIEVAKTMVTDYSDIFFDALEELTIQNSNNTAYPLLQDLSIQLNCCFDINELKLFENLLEMMLHARQISAEGYQLLQQWLHKEYERITYESTDYGNYRRQYYGFAYQKVDGKINYFIDAVKYKVSSKQAEMIREGIIVSPILSNLYQRESYHDLYNCRKLFEQLLMQYTGERYIHFMKTLSNLPATVDENLYKKYLQLLERNKNKQTMNDYFYFGNLWNVKSHL